MSTAEHVHTWALQRVLDGCHSVSHLYTCPCGAERLSGFERSPDEDLWSAVWLDQTCARCRQLIAGDDPEDWDEIRQ